jgi:hypothetical protein
MAMQDVAAAIERAKAMLRRRPEAGVHDDVPASARWLGLRDAQGAAFDAASHDLRLAVRIAARGALSVEGEEG